MSTPRQRIDEALDILNDVFAKSGGTDVYPWLEKHYRPMQHDRFNLGYDDLSITEARITEMPKDAFGKMPQVWVTINGEEEMLFRFYPDEIMFSADEFIGLTREEGKALKTKKDIEYLQSPD